LLIILAEEASAANSLSVSPSEFEERRRLRREVGELRVEKEILRKAAAYFAQEMIRSAASDWSPIIVTPMASSGSVESSGSPARLLPLPRPAAVAEAGSRHRAEQEITEIYDKSRRSYRCARCMPSSPAEACAAAASGSLG
jgi:hypothetical protein